MPRALELKLVTSVRPITARPGTLFLTCVLSLARRGLWRPLHLGWAQLYPRAIASFGWGVKLMGISRSHRILRPFPYVSTALRNALIVDPRIPERPRVAITTRDLSEAMPFASPGVPRYGAGIHALMTRILGRAPTPFQGLCVRALVGRYAHLFVSIGQTFAIKFPSFRDRWSCCDERHHRAPAGAEVVAVSGLAGI